MFKSIIASTKTIGTLTAKASVATAKGVKRAGVATGHATKAATLATGRGAKAAGHYVAEEYRSNKPVESFVYDQNVVDAAIAENIRKATEAKPVVEVKVEETKTEAKKVRAARVCKATVKAEGKAFEPVQ